MKLKHKLDEAGYSELNENLQGFYAEVDGEYYIQVEGMVPKARIDEFRENNVALLKENEDLKKKGSATDEVEKLKKELEKAKKHAEQAKGDLPDIDAELEKRVKKMREEYEAQIESVSKESQHNKQQLETLLIDNELQRAAAEQGVLPSAIADVLNRGRTVFKLNEGKAIPMNGDEVVYGKDGSTPMTINDWLAERSTDAPHWFKPSTGSGANQPKGTTQSTQQTNVRGVDRMRSARS